MKKLKFEQSSSDYCLYFDQTKTVFILLYVNDILVASVDELIINKIKSKLINSFKMRDLSIVKCFLNININFGDDTLTLHQSDTIVDLLK